MVRRKREGCPEWFWWWICNPIPFWNELVSNQLLGGALRVYISPLAHLCSVPVEARYEEGGP